MKKIFNLPLFLILFITSFSFMSCSDDEGEITTNNIVGTWRCETLDELGLGDLWGGSDYYIRFNADGSLVAVYTRGEFYVDGELFDEGEVDIYHGEWSLSGNKISTNGAQFLSSTDEITKLSDSELYVTQMGLTIVFSRVNDSVLDQYLNE